MSDKKEAVTVNGHERLESIPLSSICIDPEWNTRHKAWMQVSDKPEDKEGVTAESEGFLGFMNSIANDGQDTPVIVRPRGLNAPWEKIAPKKFDYMLVVGFRRCEAIRRIADKGGSMHVDAKNPTVKAIVRSLTEGEAQACNMRENVDRENLTTADIAFGVWRLYNDSRMTQQQIAAELGLTQGHVSKMLAIMKTCDPKVAKFWREAGAGSVTVKEMSKLAEKPREEQVDYWKSLVGEEKERATKSTAWQKKAARDAEHFGAVLGAFCNEGLLAEKDCKTALEDPETVHLYILAPQGKKVSDKLRKECSTASVKGFDVATGKVTEETKEEEGEDKPAKREYRKAHAKFKKGEEATASN